MRLNLALAQISTSLGDVQCNLDKHLNYIELARKQKADLVVFPELSLTGYVLQDLVATVAHRPTEDDPVFKPLLEARAGWVEDECSQDRKEGEKSEENHESFKCSCSDGHADGLCHNPSYL